MKWLERLKNQKHAFSEPAKPAKPTDSASEGGFVGFVGSLNTHIQKIDYQNESVNEGDTDAHCWPQSPAMTGTEIDTHIVRQKAFQIFGLERVGEMADTLTQRDREGDDRRCCLECQFLFSRSDGGVYCTNAERAIGARSRTMVIGLKMAGQLKRCDGYGVR